MRDLLQHGSDWLERTRHRHATQEVTLRRGSSSVRVRATIGRTDFESIDAAGALTRSQSRDYLILARDYRVDDQPTLPASGDQIEEDDGSLYEAMAPSGGTVWRWSDPYKNTIRFHTRFVGKQPYSGT